MGALSRIIFGIAPAETRFDRRGFRGGDASARQRLESVGAAFLDGYHAALADARPVPLSRLLETTEPERRGFAYEGAAMALALLDAITPWRRDRWAAFLAGPGEAHAYMLHVGAGWARARLGGDPDRILPHYDPLLRWLVMDGWGFHDGYFHWPRTIERRERPARVRGYAANAYDQGLGRALWFVDGAEAERVAATVSSFDPVRQPDLWSGVGLAAAYAGIADDHALATLRASAPEHRTALAQGAAFAAEARRRAGNPAPHTERACRALCGLSAAEAAETTAEALRGPAIGAAATPAARGFAADGADPAYETWRQRVRDRFRREAVAV